MSANAVAGPHRYEADRAPFAVASPARTAADPLPSFGEVLRALNPLQYLPVVGTIYRVVTGDMGSPGLRTAVSTVGSLLMGGPVGLLGSIFGDLFERSLHLEEAAHAAIAGPPPPPSPPPPTADPTATDPAAGPAVVRQAISAYSFAHRLAGT